VATEEEDPIVPDTVHVECYAGFRGDEEPRRFSASGSTVEVVEIVDRWQGPDHRYFRVRVNDGGVHLLRHDEISGIWERIPAALRSGRQ
jgi:hypothetical protein